MMTPILKMATSSICLLATVEWINFKTSSDLKRRKRVLVRISKLLLLRTKRPRQSNSLQDGASLTSVLEISSNWRSATSRRLSMKLTKLLKWPSTWTRPTSPRETQTLAQRTQAWSKCACPILTSSRRTWSYKSLTRKRKTFKSYSQSTHQWWGLNLVLSPRSWISSALRIVSALQQI